MSAHESTDELRELADLLDDLQQHKGWHAVVAEAQKMYGATITMQRIELACASHDAAEALALKTAELVAGRLAAQQVIALPKALAKEARASAVNADTRRRERTAIGLGPDVEYTP